MWEETSYQLELRQTIKDCADSEYNSYNYRTGPKYKLTFDPDDQTVARPVQVCTVEVAVIREEGTNGDREMAAALFRVGFKVWDVTMQDLLNGDVTLDRFRGIIFPGGFSYAGKFIYICVIIDRAKMFQVCSFRCTWIGQRLGGKYNVQ